MTIEERGAALIESPTQGQSTFNGLAILALPSSSMEEGQGSGVHGEVRA
jgi:hypothetical protein